MSYDYSKLRGRIVEKFGTLKAFSNAMGWSERTNGLKLNGSVEWSQNEIIKASALLDIAVGTEEMQLYFFNLTVQLNWTKANRRGI